MDYNALSIFPNARNIEEVMAIQTVSLSREDFSKTPSTFDRQ